METFTYFNIITLSIFTWYTFDTDNNGAAVTNTSVGITFIQLLLVISYHVYKYTLSNYKVFSRMQKTAICKKLKQRKQKRINHEPPSDNNIHRFHELLDMIDRPVNTNDYNIPQVRPKPVEPTYSVVEIPKPHLEPPPPPLEEIKEELEHESQQQLSEQDEVTVAKENQSALIDDVTVTVAKENLSASINENKLCSDNYLGIEIAECNDTTTSASPGISMEYSTTVEMKLVPKPHVNPQIDTENGKTMDVKLDNEEIPEMFEAIGEPKQAAPLSANTVSEMESHND